MTYETAAEKLTALLAFIDAQAETVAQDNLSTEEEEAEADEASRTASLLAEHAASLVGLLAGDSIIVERSLFQAALDVVSAAIPLADGERGADVLLALADAVEDFNILSNGGA